MSILLVALLVLFLAAGIPVAFSIGLSSMGFFFIWGQLPLNFLFQQMFTGIDSFPLLAIPFFILAGELMLQANIMDILLDFVNYLVGRVRGGLAYVNIVGSMFFAGITGSGSGDTAALGSILIPAMKKSGYELDYTVAVTAASSVVGPIIPPSIAMVLYGSILPVSIGALFAGGMIPGILIGLSLLVVAYILSARKHHPKSIEKVSVKGFIKSFVRTFPALLMPIIILGGILSGAFTPTEASATAAAFALFAGTVIYRTLTIRKIIDSFVNAAITASIILLIASVSIPFGQIIAFLQVPQQLVSLISNLTSNASVGMFLILVFLLIIGATMDTTPIILVLGPILAPLAVHFGIDPLHFGVIFVMNAIIGLATPPFGLCIFVGSAIGEIKVEKVVRAILPFIAAEIAILFLCAYVPQIVLFIPKLLGFIK